MLLDFVLQSPQTYISQIQIHIQLHKSKETITKSFKTKITERNKSRSKKKKNLSDPDTLNVEPIESQCYEWKRRRVSYPMISLDQSGDEIHTRGTTRGVG